jgi:hypothetical protein
MDPMNGKVYVKKPGNQQPGQITSQCFAKISQAFTRISTLGGDSNFFLRFG